MTCFYKRDLPEFLSYRGVTYLSWETLGPGLKNVWSRILNFRAGPKIFGPECVGTSQNNWNSEISHEIHPRAIEFLEHFIL
jgi:hypothetical protein